MEVTTTTPAMAVGEAMGLAAMELLPTLLMATDVSRLADLGCCTLPVQCSRSCIEVAILYELFGMCTGLDLRLVMACVALLPHGVIEHTEPGKTCHNHSSTAAMLKVTGLHMLVHTPCFASAACMAVASAAALHADRKPWVVEIAVPEKRN